MNRGYYEEGDQCPECTVNQLEYRRKGSCSCHINPPCSSCTDAPLVCDYCGWEAPEPEPPPPLSPEQRDAERAVWAKYAADFEAARQRGHILPSGGRIFNIHYDGRSGSTMEFTGDWEGPVTKAELFEHLGEGSFGHRGPFIYGGPDKGRFSYTKITD